MISQKSVKMIAVGLTLTSFAGLLDALYLTSKHYSNSPINCLILNGCDTVMNSKYATIGSLPVSLLGVLFYFSIFVLAAAASTHPRKKIFDFILFISAAGFIFSLWLVYLQIFVIKALCLYCLISAALTATIFKISVIYKLKAEAIFRPVKTT